MNGKNALPKPAGPTVRCAVYVRVSTDEQAALEYNSLQAQEEICKNYIAIRSSDPALERKWVHAETYSDPGYSGGTLDRPALRRLLSDVEAGRIDAIAVYKLDRLSRSISQFYEVWRLLEHHGVDFASATQDFNTATSQGKLMLNLLLSFGQFEREQIGERTRDKVRAARKRGKWTGGSVPLGYALDPVRHLLVPIPEEAELVRTLFHLYGETRSIGMVAEKLNALGFTQKRWTTKKGRVRGGQSWDKNAVLRVLRNPLVAGKVPESASGTLHKGEHEGIISWDTFQKAQRGLDDHSTGKGPRKSRRNEFLLTGILRCGPCDAPMTSSSARGGSGKRTRYYRCVRSHQKGVHCPTGLLPVGEIESAVVEQVRKIAQNGEVQAAILRQLEQTEPDPKLVAQKTRLEGRLRELSGAATKLLDGFREAKNGGGKLLAGRLAELEAEMDQVRRNLGTVERELREAESAKASAEEVAKLLDSFGEVWEALLPFERRALLHLVIRSVTVGDGSLKIAFHDLHGERSPMEAPESQPPAQEVALA